MFCCNKKNICIVSILVIMTFGIYMICHMICKFRHYDCCCDLYDMEDMDHCDGDIKSEGDYKNQIRDDEKSHDDLEKKVDEFNSKRINRDNDANIKL